MAELSINGMAIASNVLERIVAIAAAEVEGVVSVGASGVGGLKAILMSKSNLQGIEIEATEDDTLNVAVHVEVRSEYALPEIAANIRNSVADAVKGQVGLAVNAVDVFVDGIRFVK